MTMPSITVHTDDKQFCVCLPPVIEQEGYPGNSNDPHDPGGRTHAGIIQREYNIYRARKNMGARSVYQADWAEVCDIYHEQYWLPWAMKMWPGLDLMFFDQAVNQGPTQATRNVQRAINAFHDPGTMAKMLRAVSLHISTVAVDGHMGMITLDALESVHDHKGFLKTYYEQDLNFYRHLKNWYYFGRGWGRRAKEIYQQAVAMAPAATMAAVAA